MPEESPLAPLLKLDGVHDAVEAAREACTAVRWHNALRRRIPEAATESRVRGARASAFLEGADFEVDFVRDLFRGAVQWPADPGPLERTMRSAIQVTAESERVAPLVMTATAQGLVRLHVAAAADLTDADALARPRSGDEDSREFTEIGPAPAAAEAAARLRALGPLIASSVEMPGLVTAAIVHAELVTARPFARGNGLVARACERALLTATGLDTTGVVVPEIGHARKGTADYLGALTAYGTGSADGVRLWLIHCAEAVEAGAIEAMKICDAVQAGRLG